MEPLENSGNFAGVILSSSPLVYCKSQNEENWFKNFRLFVGVFEKIVLPALKVGRSGACGVSRIDQWRPVVPHLLDRMQFARAFGFSRACASPKVPWVEGARYEQHAECNGYSKSTTLGAIGVYGLGTC